MRASWRAARWRAASRGGHGRRRPARRRGGRAARDGRRARRRSRAGAGNDFARKLGIGDRPGGGLRRARRRPRARRSTSPRPTGATYLGIASAGIDSDVQDIANATRLPLGAARLRVRDAAGARALAAGALARSTVDGEAHVVPRVLRRGGELGRLRRRHVPGAPARRSTTACSTSCSPRDEPAPQLPRNLPRVFSGTHVDSPRLVVPARAARSPSPPTARSRPTRTATRWPRCPSPSGSRRARCGCSSHEPARPEGGGRARRSARSCAPRAAAAARRCPERSSRGSSRTRSACWRGGCGTAAR